MKPLVRVSATDVAGLTFALRRALSGGPAVWPVPGAGRVVALEDAGEVEDGIALVVETSGSTDAPKRVLLSGAALRASAVATEAALSGPGQWLLALPGHYIAGAQVLVRSIVAGTEPVVLDGDGFEPTAFAAASARLDRLRPRYTSLVPVQLSRLVEAARTDRTVADALHRFDRILLGGQAASPSLIVAADALGLRVTRTYGSSETAGGCVYDGRALDGVRVRIVDGRVEVSGPMLADGYLGDPARTADAFVTDADGTRWYRTGDLGDVAYDGILRIRGRADDVIISGGVKVALGEVERAVRSVPGFGDAVVVRVPDAEWGERAAVVTMRTDAAAASDALTTLVAATDAAGLTPAARPVRLELIDRLPLLASGKPDRRALEARMRGGREEG
ncbi:O-succinylbenzoic acid--CoA ligase [Agromyces sp. 3263]|uniref:AMP-binding protein n=1 Tax=Agromyces sp. 3263 TaxID=2817750 RepID=UPI002861F159|nr:AMP-binding protein [Agromyces sp. 3263]MDR6905415.1 O-succinylbenzoic acid--CoA ligase [Agromyces sp. 3263]